MREVARWRENCIGEHRGSERAALLRTASARRRHCAGLPFLASAKQEVTGCSHVSGIVTESFPDHPGMF